jgi:hypothetical protein
MKSSRTLAGRITLSLLVAGVAGCGGAGSEAVVPGTASCTLVESVALGGTPVTLEICQELVGGASPSDIDNLRRSCVAPSSPPDAGIQVEARFQGAPCSHEGALGGCRITQGGKTVGNWYYKTGQSGDIQPDSIQQLCALIGATFVPA